MDKAKIISKLDCFRGLFNKWTCLSALLTRLVIAHVFFWAGWGKLNNLDRVTGFFESLGIPLAGVQAPFVAGLEFVGGIALLLGIATRFFALQFMFVMAVAIFTAHWGDFSNLGELFKMSQFLYIVALFHLVTGGPGKISVDHLVIAPRLFK